MGPLRSDREAKTALQGKGGWFIGKMFQTCPVALPKVHVTHTPVIHPQTTFRASADDFSAIGAVNLVQAKCSPFVNESYPCE